MLEIRNLSKSYGRDLVLDDVSLDVDEGDVVAIVGPSGAGKSTFLRCINLLETFHAGSVVLNGRRVGFVQSGAKLRHMTSRELARQRRGIGMVFQDFNLFSHMTALENIVEAPRRVLGLSKAESRERATSLLTQVGLSGKGDSYPHQLSGGQQQRVAIARSLAMRPQLMLFDEATSALDPELVGEVLDVMKGLAQQGMTMLVVTHEMEFAREVSSSVAVMADGRIVEAGPTSVVLSTPQNERARVFLRRTMSRAGASTPNASSQAQP